MLFFSRDLLNDLQRQRERTERTQRALIDEVHRLIQQGEAIDEELLRRIKTPGPRAPLEQYDSQRVYPISAIRETCTQYRLRFLPLQYYRPALPYEALLQVRKLEEQNDVQLKQLYIMAPAEAFQLEKKNDPLLFVALGNGNYLLVHQWGRDLTWIRKAYAFPLRNLTTLAVVLVCFSLLVALLIPSSWISFNEALSRTTYSIRMYLFFMLVLATLFSALFLHVRRNKNLSEDEWDSKHL